MAEERNLGFWETLKVFTHDLFKGHDLVVVDLHLKGAMNAGLLKRSFQYGFNKHPLLRATIHEKNNAYFFSINLNWNDIPFHVIQEIHQNQCHEIIEEEMGKCFQKEKNLWRITLLESKDQTDFHLILSFHHAMCDATAIFSFLDATLKNYERLEQGDDIQITPLSIQEPQDKVLPKKIDWEKYLENATKFQATGKQGWKFNKNVPINKRTPHYIKKQLSLSKINQLKEKCKQHNVSLNALLNATALLTKQQLDDEPYNGTLCSWVNTRGYCSPEVSAEHFGYFVNLIATEHNNINAKTNVWDLAKEYYEKLNQRLPELSYFPETFNQKQVMASYNMKQGHEMDHFLYDFSLSYLSKAPLSMNYGNLKLVDIDVAVNWNGGFAGLLLEILTFSDHITFACCYAEPLLETSWVERFMDCFERNLLSL